MKRNRINQVADAIRKADARPERDARSLANRMIDTGHVHISWPQRVLTLVLRARRAGR